MEQARSEILQGCLAGLLSRHSDMQGGEAAPKHAGPPWQNWMELSVVCRTELRPR